MESMTTKSGFISPICLKISPVKVSFKMKQILKLCFIAAALFIGLSAGIICFTATIFIKQHLRIDDSLDVFPVHGVGGMLGTLFAGVFVASQFGGAGLADGMTIGSQLMVQIIGILATLAWTALMTFLILKLVGAFITLRVSEDEETEGLDLVSHEEKGYNL